VANRLRGGFSVAKKEGRVAGGVIFSCLAGSSLRDAFDGRAIRPARGSRLPRLRPFGYETSQRLGAANRREAEAARPRARSVSEDSQGRGLRRRALRGQTAVLVKMPKRRNAPRPDGAGRKAMVLICDACARLSRRRRIAARCGCPTGWGWPIPTAEDDYDGIAASCSALARCQGERVESGDSAAVVAELWRCCWSGSQCGWGWASMCREKLEQ